MKEHYGWTDESIAEICGYKSRESFVQSLHYAKKFPLQGMITVFEMENGFNDKAVFI
jgi:hypothetical protein